MRGCATPAARLRPVARQRGTLQIPAPGKRYDHVFFRDQILFRDVALVVGDLGAARVGVVFLDLAQLAFDHRAKLVGVAQDALQAADLLLQLAVLALQLFTFQTRKPLETHIQNRLRLHVGKAELGD